MNRFEQNQSFGQNPRNICIIARNQRTQHHKKQQKNQDNDL